MGILNFIDKSPPYILCIDVFHGDCVDTFSYYRYIDGTLPTQIVLGAKLIISHISLSIDDRLI